MIKNNKGLTLVNLIATLVLMLIITYITVSLVVGDEGVISEADNIKNQSEIEDVKEKIYLSVIKNTAENGDIDIDAIKSEVENEDIENISLDGNKIKFEYNGMEYEVDVNDVSDTVKAGYNNSSTPNAPYLMSGMEPIKWIKGQDGKDIEVPTNENDKEWYNYDKQLWANAKTVEDGSYWVWIPRYEYKITYYTDETKIEETESITKDFIIDINFISKEKTIPTPGYKIHPAFTDGTDNHFDNGEWDKEISGIWVAKYTMSGEENISGEWKINNDLEDISILEREGIRSVSKFVSGCFRWNSISIENSYENSFFYDRKKESHLIKNSEWGAIAYLSYSKYGTTDLIINEKYSTNNKTGVYYDMPNMTATYVDKEGSKKVNYYKKFYKTNNSTKYITKYPNINQEYIDNRMNNITNIYGDALFEVGILSNDGTEILFPNNGDGNVKNVFKYTSNCIFARSYLNTNTNKDMRFGFGIYGGGDYDARSLFRVVLIGE